MSDVFRMEGPQNGYGSYFSPADFGDHDEQKFSLGNMLTSSDDYVSMQKTMENLSVAVMNALEEEFVNRDASIDKNNFDEINRIRTFYTNIKHRLVAIGCAGHLEQIEKFIKPVEDHISYKVINEFASKLDVENFNDSSKDFFPKLCVDLSGSDFFMEEFGTDLDTFKITLKNVLSAYDKAYMDLFDSDERLNSTVKKFTDLSKQVNTILDLEVNDASMEVFKSVTKYLGEFFKTQNVKQSFDEFIKARKRFVTLRDIILRCKKTLSNTDEHEICPPCSICMNEPIKTAFVPCGHTFCQTCATKNILVCYICRTKIERKLKLYF